VQDRVTIVARNAAQHFQKQGIAGTDLYLSALGPALAEVGRHWPITDMAGRAVDLTDALDRAYRAVGQFRLDQILTQELPAYLALKPLLEWARSGLLPPSTPYTALACPYGTSPRDLHVRLTRSRSILL
jgi:hypothetical protein